MSLQHLLFHYRKNLFFFFFEFCWPTGHLELRQFLTSNPGGALCPSSLAIGKLPETFLNGCYRLCVLLLYLFFPAEKSKHDSWILSSYTE